MGGAVEEGGRRTRSSARGSVTTTPVTPAPKKPRVSRSRAKPKKIDVDDEANDAEEVRWLLHNSRKNSRNLHFL